MSRDRGLRIIIVYKFVKGGLWLLLAIGLAVTTKMGLGRSLEGFAAHLRHHAGAWSLELADLVTKAASGRALWVLALALVADGLTSLLEGWALWYGHWWGPWLVVVASGSLLPFEVRALIRHPHLVRFVVLAVNVAIVAYLARRAGQRIADERSKPAR